MSGRLIGVARTLTFPGGRQLPRGAYREGETITTEEADAVVANPTFGREIEERDAVQFGGVAVVAEPGNRFVSPVAGARAPAASPGPAGAEPGNAFAPPVGPPTLEAPNERLAEHLLPLDESGRESFWSAFDADDLNTFLADRFGVEVKERPPGTAANMIESRLGL